MKNEYNHNIGELYDIPPNKQASEYNNPEEFGDIKAKKEENREFARPKKTLTQQITEVVRVANITAVTTGLTIVLIGGGIIATDIIKKDDYNISFNTIEEFEHSIYYNIDVGDLKDATIKIYNDGYEYEITADIGENEGEFHDLDFDTEYKIAVCQDDVLKEVSVKTKKFEYTYTTPLEEIEVVYECKCNVDGYFHFTILYEDTENVYYDFSAYLEDMEGNISKCEFIGNFNQEQIIDISNIYATEEEAKFVVTCKMNNETYTLIEENVRI